MGEGWGLDEEAVESLRSGNGGGKLWMGQRQYASISSGDTHTCAIGIDEVSLVCWGDNRFGQSSPRGGERLAGPEPAPSPEPDALFVAISSGATHGCGITKDGTAQCWGNNDHGRASPPPGEKFLDLSSGFNHTCGIRDDGLVVCWGQDDQGQASAPTEGSFKVISSGGSHTCALRDNGAAVCWGADFWGESSPPEGETFADIDSGAYHTCGLGLDGTAVCWGPQIGDRIEFSGEVGEQVGFGQTRPPEGERFIAISSSSLHICALREDGAPVCWGDNGNQQASPPEGERFVALSSSRNRLDPRTCGLRGDGTAICWGDDGLKFGSGLGSPLPGMSFQAFLVWNVWFAVIGGG